MARIVPYLLLLVVVGALGFAAGSVLEPLSVKTDAVSAQLEPEAPRLARELARARAENTDLAEQLRSHRATIDELRGRLAQARTRNETQQDRISELRAELDNLATAVPAAGPTLPSPAETRTGSEPAVPVSSTPEDPAPADRTALPRELEEARPSANALSARNPDPAQSESLAEASRLYREGAYAEAYGLWLPIAQSGVVRAQFHLGALLYEGRGVPRNDALSYAWLSLAERSGSSRAGDLLRELERRMDEAALERGRALLEPSSDR